MNKEILYTDVCIIGAGPAGAAASITLSKNKIPHILVDAASFPRHKPCGDIITSGVLRILNELDPRLLINLKKESLLNPVWSTSIYPTNGKPISIDFLPFDKIPGKPSCYSVSRFDMDEVILNKVAESPFVTIRQNCRIVAVNQQEGGVELITGHGDAILSKMIIAATGSNNNILRILGLAVPKEDSAIGIRAHFEGLNIPKDETSLFLSSDIMPGGFYITPLPENRCNVNLVMSLGKVSSENINLKEKFETVIAGNPILKKMFEKASRIGNFEGSMLFLGIRKRVVAGDRFLVVGDSAGLIEFFSGNGIPQAFQSGKMAALQVVKAIEDQDFSKKSLEKFDLDLHRKVKLNYTMGRFLYAMLHKKFLSNLVLRFLNYLSDRPQTNGMLRDLLYHKNPNEMLANPRFLYNLLFRRNGTESPSVQVDISDRHSKVEV